MTFPAVANHIYHACSREQSRYSLDHVQMTATLAYATDGKALVRVMRVEPSPGFETRLIPWREFKADGVCAEPSRDPANFPPCDEVAGPLDADLDDDYFPHTVSRRDLTTWLDTFGKLTCVRLRYSLGSRIAAEWRNGNLRGVAEIASEEGFGDHSGDFEIGVDPQVLKRVLKTLGRVDSETLELWVPRNAAAKPFVLRRGLWSALVMPVRLD